jgi:HlyD family secretion protein
MDTAVLNAQRQEASAQLERAIIAVETSESLVTQRIAEKAAAEALVAQRLAEKDAAEKRLNRSEQLSRQNAIAEQTLDDHRATVQSSLAAVNAARAQVAAAEAAIGTARSQVVSAKTAVVAARASVERIDADISDSFLKSPRDGRVQYLISQPGEVVGSGGRILNMADLSDVYMGFFLPTAAAGVIELNSEARIILDAAPDYVIPATITYVADVAQFTPKTVETASERQKLMFRVKATIPQDLLKKHLQQIKTGLPGMAYVRLDPSQPWPEALTIKLPPKPISLTETQ